MRKPIMSARLRTVWSGQRGSSMQRARRSATRSRFSTSARGRTPLLDDNMPPSKRATTDLPPTDDKPLSGSVGSFMAGVVSGNDRIGFDNQILRHFNGLHLIRQPLMNFSG